MDNFKKNITRRKFVKGIAGATACCECFPLKSLAASAGNSEHNIKEGGVLVGPRQVAVMSQEASQEGGVLKVKMMFLTSKRWF